MDTEREIDRLDAELDKLEDAGFGPGTPTWDATAAKRHELVDLNLGGDSGPPKPDTTNEDRAKAMLALEDAKIAYEVAEEAVEAAPAGSVRRKRAQRELEEARRNGEAVSAVIEQFQAVEDRTRIATWYLERDRKETAARAAREYDAAYTALTAKIQRQGPAATDPDDLRRLAELQETADRAKNTLRQPLDPAALAERLKQMDVESAQHAEAMRAAMAPKETAQ